MAMNEETHTKGVKTNERMVAKPMCNQAWFTETDYANEELGRFPTGEGFPGKASAVVVGACPSAKPPGRAFRCKSSAGLPGLRAFRSNPSREMRG